MIRGLSYDQLAQRLIEDDKNLLLLDTCCLLDIVRCLPRGKTEIFDSALNIFNAINESNLSFNIVLPSPVPQEWSDHIDAVVSETGRFIEEQFNSLSNIKRILTEIDPDIILDFGPFNKRHIEQKLKMISQEIMDKGYVCEIDDEVRTLAANRVFDSRPPSRKSKASREDCVIYEEVLHIARLLRKADFHRKIIFASSDTQEYYDNRFLHPSIKEELDERDIKFFSSLNGAESEAKKYDLQGIGTVDNST
jgi:hypothetical protein